MQLPKKYPIRKDISSIAKDWNELFKNNKNILSVGVSHGWLNERIDTRRITNLDYAPYHMRVGLVTHSGYLSIEEEFLLKDAFNALINAEYYHALLLKYGSFKKNQGLAKNEDKFSADTYNELTDIKRQISSYARLSVVSFYSFVEFLLIVLVIVIIRLTRTLYQVMIKRHFKERKKITLFN